MSSTPTGSSPSIPSIRPVAKVLVATTAMLTFISFWRAAAIVLNDLASSAYYAGGEAEQFIGKTAPWFILAIMLFSYAVSQLYVESCSMFVRGGVYRVVKEALGGDAREVLRFGADVRLHSDRADQRRVRRPVSRRIAERTPRLRAYSLHVCAERDRGRCSRSLVTLYFWWQNIKGIPESSEKALWIMQLTTVMVVVLIAWCIYTLLVRGGHLPPAPVPHNIVMGEHALGWLAHSRIPQMFTLVAVFIGLGHSVLAMSGEESLAQVYREIEHPKLPNLKKAALVIFIYSMVFTSLVSFFAVMIIPDKTRPQFFENLIGGLAMSLTGPFVARLIFHVFVVVVGTLILSGAVNTAIVGSNGVLNRVSEDGVLSDWFRQPHPKFGTSHRIINMVVVLQIVTIVISRGDVTFLANLYAFGVIWSFALNGIAVLVLRYTHPQEREFQVPLNFQIGRNGNPARPGADHADAARDRGRELVHQAGGDDFGCHFLRRAFRGIRDFRETDSGGASESAARGTSSSISSIWRRKAILTLENVGVQPGNILVPVSTQYALYPLEAALAARQAQGGGNRGAARSHLAARSHRRVRSVAGSAFQHHRAASVHQGSVDRGKGRQAGSTGRRRRERSVGRHSAHGGKSAVKHGGRGKFVENDDHRAGARNRSRLGTNGRAAAARNAGNSDAVGTGADFLSRAARAAAHAEGN